jgi:hypothetical protein
MKLIWPLLVWGRAHRRASIALTVLAALLLVGGIGSAVSSKNTRQTATIVTPSATQTPAATLSTLATGSPTPTSSPTPSPSPSASPTLRLVTTATGAIEPNRTLTPGATFPAATAAIVCVSGYSASVRNVPDSVRHAVFATYAIDYALHSNYELDHLISLELGGDNAAANLWPEPLNGAGGARVKDKLENKLHSLVCSGQLGLPAAQQAIAGDWAGAFAKYEAVAVSAPAPAPAPVYVAPAPAYTAPAPAPADVYYANCAAARAAGVAPIMSGAPGYRPGLDRDGDGIACE